MNKMAEGRFFLRKLQEEGQKAVRNEPGAFGYYLSAFLGAARSVTFVLQKEMKDTYDAWFPKWFDGLSPEDQELLKFMNQQRVSEVKRLGAETITRERAVPAEQVPGFQIIGPPTILLGEEHLKKTEELGLPPWTQAWVYIPEWYFDGIGEVLEVCERYVSLLERLLREFLAAREPKPNPKFDL